MVRGTLILLAAVAFLALIDAAWVATTADRELRAVTGGKGRYRAVPGVRTSLWVHLTPPER